MHKVKAHSRRVTAPLVSLAGQFPTMIETLEAHISEIAGNMEALRKAGLIYANPHWRKDSNGEPKYLYLLHPQKTDQERVREYVGCDPEKIKAAEAAMERAREYDELSRQLKELQYRVDQAERAFSDAKRALTGASRY